MTEHDWLEYDVVVVDDEEDNLDAFRFAFRKSFRLHYAKSGAEALELVAALEPAVVIADQRMPGMSGIEFLGRVKSLRPECYAILLTAYAELQVLVDAVNSGAVDRYVAKPWDSKEFPSVIRQGIAAFATLRENRELREQLAHYAAYLERAQRDPLDFGALSSEVRLEAPRVGGVSPRLLDAIETIAETAGPVVIEGESGVESELVARAIHIGSPRESRPFVAVMAGAFSGESLERELFGWGAPPFEGAARERAGRCELADGGTLWLHEPNELSPSLQARLLRMLSEGRVERVGETRARRVDVRLIVSVVGGVGRLFGPEPALPELLARLSVFPIRLPPLRTRLEELPLLAEHFLARYAERNERRCARLTEGALMSLSSHSWPGNVRELERVLERAAIVARGQDIQSAHLDFEAPGPGSLGPLGDRLEALERGELARALELHGGNKAEVARALGIHRTTLYYRLKKLGLDS
jgi:two-component system response regulator AtoC